MHHDHLLPPIFAFTIREPDAFIQLSCGRVVRMHGKEYSWRIVGVQIVHGPQQGLLAETSSLVSLIDQQAAHVILFRPRIAINEDIAHALIVFTDQEELGIGHIDDGLTKRFQIAGAQDVPLLLRDGEFQK